MSALMDQSNMDGLLTSANILLHNSAKSAYFVNYWKLGEHDKLDMFEHVWLVQHVNKVDSDDVDLDD